MAKYKESSLGPFVATVKFLIYGNGAIVVNVLFAILAVEYSPEYLNCNALNNGSEANPEVANVCQVDDNNG